MLTLRFCWWGSGDDTKGNWAAPGSVGWPRTNFCSIQSQNLFQIWPPKTDFLCLLATEQHYTSPAISQLFFNWPHSKVAGAAPPAQPGGLLCTMLSYTEHFCGYRREFVLPDIIYSTNMGKMLKHSALVSANLIFSFPRLLFMWPWWSISKYLNVFIPGWWFVTSSSQSTVLTAAKSSRKPACGE